MFNTRFSTNEKGVTLIEIVVVIAIIAIFCTVMISDFPTIEKQFALSRASYSLAQDLRKAQDLGLSGVSVINSNSLPMATSGYGVYLNLSNPTQYIIYADIRPDSTTPGDNEYGGNFDYSHAPLCTSLNSITIIEKTDCIISIIDITKENSSLSIKGIDNINGAFTSINFSPPDPTTTIDNIVSASKPITINLTNGLGTRSVQVNSSGLINVQ